MAKILRFICCRVLSFIRLTSARSAKLAAHYFNVGTFLYGQNKNGLSVIVSYIVASQTDTKERLQRVFGFFSSSVNSPSGSPLSKCIKML